MPRPSFPAWPALACCLAAVPAGAQDTWTEPFPGVRHLHRQLPNQNINAALVDLCRDGVSVRVTATNERGQRTSAFGASVGAQLAINGDYFVAGYRTDGFTVHDGQPWPDTGDHGEVGQAAFGEELVQFHHHEELLSPQWWWKEVMSGHWTLITDGRLEVLGEPGAHPRTAVGLTRDRRTLVLVAVDGRAAGRQGMTFPELQLLMQDLGAHWALALDGGGSTTMWMEGRGILNYPSDGSERTVANHLAVYATGSGAPRHCDRAVEEVLGTFPNVQEGDSTDVDGDGKADACGRDRDGVVCARSTGTGFEAPFRGPPLSDAANWWWPTLGLTLRMADLDGDGKADACARDGQGLHCWPSTGAGFGAEWTLPDVGGAPFDEIDNVTTLMLGDWTGDGKADVCMRANEGLACWPSTGRGFGARVSVPEFTDADGFTRYGSFGSLRMADVDGDGRLDVCGRNELRLVCRLSDGAGFPARVEGPYLPSAYGFDLPRYGLTLRMADVDGDGRADACFRTFTDFRCHLSTGAGFAVDPVIGPALHEGFGWGLHRYHSTIRLLDMDGDGDREVCARSGNLVACWRWEGAGWMAMHVDGPPLSDATGWGLLPYYWSLREADVNGDGKDDLCARAAAGVFCWLSNGVGFPTQVHGPAWSDADWHWLIHAPSLRIASPPKPPRETCNGRDDDHDGLVDEGCPAADAGIPDAGEPDAGATDGGEADGGSADAGGATETDGGSGEPDGGAGPGDVTGGCGCGVGAGPGAAAWLALGVVLARASRARRGHPVTLRP